MKLSATVIYLQIHVLKQSSYNKNMNLLTSPPAPKKHEIPANTSAGAAGCKSPISDSTLVGLQVSSVTLAGSDEDKETPSGSETVLVAVRSWVVVFGAPFTFITSDFGKVPEGDKCSLAGRKRRKTSLDPGIAAGKRN